MLPLNTRTFHLTWTKDIIIPFFFLSFLIIHNQEDKHNKDCLGLYYLLLHSYKYRVSHHHRRWWWKWSVRIICKKIEREQIGQTIQVEVPARRSFRGGLTRPSPLYACCMFKFTIKYQSFVSDKERNERNGSSLKAHLREKLKCSVWEFFGGPFNFVLKHRKIFRLVF